MKSTILLEIDSGSDSDLLAIAQEISDAVANNTDLVVLSAKPWKRDATASVLPPPLPPTL